MSARAVTTGFLLSTTVALASVATPARAATTPPGFEQVGPDLGLTGIKSGHHNVVWIDVDLDDHAEPIWLSGAQGMQRAGLDAAGAFEVLPVPVLGAQELPSSGTHTAAAPIDVDGDGRDELVLALGSHVHLLRVELADGFLIDPVPLPLLPSGRLNEIAAGDLNGDGRPDLLFSMELDPADRSNAGRRVVTVYVNQGAGRFTRTQLEPAGARATRGTTLVDLDGDGRVDVLEAIDASAAEGFARVLLNVTEPGSVAPTFAPAAGTWDTGTFATGLAVGDVDQDGHLDVYATSMGLDLFALGGPGGASWTPATLAWGFAHELGPAGLRLQWSPSLVDVDADGDLDLFARHGAALPTSAGLDKTTAQVARDLLYLKDDDAAHFTRVATPWSEDGPTRGRQATFGDLDGDGLPDVALAGVDGADDLWRNVTDLDGRRALTIALRPTASGRPAPGTRVVATCDGVSHTRVATNGGKSGAHPPAHLFFGWTACASGEVTVTADWLSGASSEHEVTAGTTFAAIEEPAADTEPAATPAWVLHADRALPHPGEEVVLTAAGVPGEAGEVPVLVADGEPTPWDSGDEAQALHIATLTVPTDASALELTLDDGSAQLTLPVGWLLHPLETVVRAYPYEAPVFGTFPWEVWLTAPPGDVAASTLDQLVVETPTGQPLDPTIALGSRVHVSFPWEALQDLDTVIVRDGAHGLSLSFPVVAATDIATTAAHYADVELAILRPRAVSGGDITPVVLSPLDANGLGVPLVPNGMLLEVTGAEVMGEPQPIGGVHDYLGVLRTGDDPGPGTVTLRSTDGDVLAEATFELRPPSLRPPDPDAAVFQAKDDVLFPGAFLQASVLVVDAWGEALAADCPIALEVSGGTLLDGPSIGGLDGAWRFTVDTDDEASELTVTATCEGQPAGTHTWPFESLDSPFGPPPRAATRSGAWTPGQLASPDPPPDPPADGCTTGAAPTAAWPLLTLLAALRATGRRRTRRRW